MTARPIDPRRDRLAEALRANLRRRKAQARGREETEGADGAEGAAAREAPGDDVR